MEPLNEILGPATFVFIQRLLALPWSCRDQRICPLLKCIVIDSRVYYLWYCVQAFIQSVHSQ